MKHVLSLGLALLLVLSLFTACGTTKESTSSAVDSVPESASEVKSTDETPSTSADDGEKPHIVFYHGYFQDDWQPAVEMRELYEQFATEHADAFTFEAIALETGNQGVYDKAIQEIALGSFPDIVDLSGMNIIPAAKEAGLILDLKPYIDEDQSFRAGIGVNYEQNMIDGSIYTVRDQLETIGFWYNEELFQAAGAKTPDEWDSWEDFNEAVDALVASPDVETPFSMNQNWPTSILTFGHLLRSEEGRAFTSTFPTDFDNAAFRGTVDFLRENVLGKIDNSFFTAAESDAYREDFFEGRAAMLFNGVWESGSFGSVAIDPAVIKPGFFPTDEPGKKAAIVSASPGYVVNGSMDETKTAACIEFIKFMTGEETAKVIFEKAQAMPPHTEIDYDVYIAGDYSVTVKSLAAACKDASGATYKSQTMGAAWDQDIAAALAGKFAGIKDGSKTTDQIVEELNSILGD